MVRIGLTYGNLMAGLRPTNEKLRRRAVSVCVSAAGCDGEQALASLRACDWDVPTAVVALVCAVGPAEARGRLAASGGNIRQAVAAG
jgi:N-acetylmuramic acid 6-phosphate etherase